MPPVVAPTEILIPDCCNIGVVFRVLLAVNAAVLAGIMLQSGSPREGLLNFVEASIVIELGCLWSLFVLCVTRRLLLRSGAIGAISLWGQRLLCATVPAAVTGAIVDFFVSFDWFLNSFVHLTVMKTMVFAGLIGLAFQHYFELRTRAYSPALMEARLQALQARIRPHFLFNSLNAVLSLIRSEPQRAESTLEDLADLFRVLMSDPRSMTTLEDEIRLCRQYLSIEKIRLGERLQMRWDMESIQDEVLRQARIPVLLLQPLLENAVRYGVEPAVEPVLIRVRVSRSLDSIDISVINPYHGDAANINGNHMALANIRERLMLLYDVEGQLVTAVERGFFEVRLHIPYTREAL